MEKRTDTEYKNITIFLYIKLPLLALVQKHPHMLLSNWEALFLTFWFFFFFWFQIVQRALHGIRPVRCSFFQQHPAHFVFFKFHITKLQLYSHMFKFNFLFLNALNKQQNSSVLRVTLRLQNYFFLLSSSVLRGAGGGKGENVREE